MFSLAASDLKDPTKFPRFVLIYRLTRQLEGIPDHNNSWDVGGKRTVWGLSVVHNPTIVPKLQKGKFSLEQAEVYTYNKYYKAYGYHNIQDPNIAFLVFDARFTGKSKMTFKTLQLAVELQLAGEVNLKIDGKIGSKSISAINRLTKKQVEQVLHDVSAWATSIGGYYGVRRINLLARRYDISKQEAISRFKDLSNGFGNRARVIANLPDYIKEGTRYA